MFEGAAVGTKYEEEKEIGEGNLMSMKALSMNTQLNLPSSSVEVCIKFDGFPSMLL
jgi:hypothetical protein